MKILLVGNHTCGNRGDGAILRGLLSSIRAQDPSVEIDTITRYPVSSSYLLGEPLLEDNLYNYHQRSTNIINKLWKKISRTLLPHFLHFSVLGWWKSWLPKHIREHLAFLEQYDAVIQVGGSFFVDLYKEAQFEHSLCAIIAKKPLFFLGHSVGPFKKTGFNFIAKTVFNKVDLVYLREQVSFTHMQSSDIPTDQTHSGADTAWLVNVDDCAVPAHLLSLVKEDKTIAVTLRELAPFDKRLGIPQERYEQAFADVIDDLIDQGYTVIALSTCTGIDSYHKDDRMIGLRVADKLKNKHGFTVIMDELDDVELGGLLSHCILTIGTRLHSAIISMNFNTPAIALNYEHKSEGIMKQLGLPLFSKEVKSLLNGELLKFITSTLESIAEHKKTLNSFVLEEKLRANDMVSKTLVSINEQVQNKK